MKNKLLMLALTILLIVPLNVFATVEPTKEFYINDYANILSEETEKYILEKSVALEKETTAQIVVVTVENLENDSLEEYATKLFREFGIGDKEENNGLLLLLALEERQFRVEVGYGLEGVLPDGLTGRYQDEYIIPYLKEDKWDEGIKNGYNAFYKKVAEFYNLNVDDIKVEEVGTSTSETPTVSIFWFIFLGAFWNGIRKETKRKKLPVLLTGILGVCNIGLIVYTFFYALPSLILGIIMEFIFIILPFSGGGGFYYGSYRVVRQLGG